MTVTMAMTSLSVVFSVFVLHIHHRGSHNIRAPAWLRQLTFFYLAPALGVVTSPEHRRRQVVDAEDCWTSRRCSSVHANGVTQQKVWSSPTRVSSRDTQRSCATHSSSMQHRDTRSQATYNDYQPIRLQRHTWTHLQHEPTDLADDVTLNQNMTSSYADDNLQLQLLSHLQAQAARQVREDAAERVRKEWHDVSAVIDRLLFVIFFLVTVLSTVGILLVQPTFKNVHLEDAIAAASQP